MSEVIRAWFDKTDPASVNESLGCDLVNAFTKIFDISRKSTWPVTARHAKAGEELGELGTCVLVEQGYMRHKKLKESSIGEAADTIICVLDVLFASWPQESRADLIRELTNQLFTKSDKWDTIVDDLNKLQAADPTDPGNDVGVLREHIRHLERRVRQLHAERVQPQAA